MIALLRGVLHSRSGKRFIIDVQGVGYEVFCTAQVSERFGLGSNIEIPVHLEAREDSLTLYGFGSSSEKEVFQLLLKVKGIGARTAIEVLSSISSLELLRSIGAGDLSRLSKIKGIGKKTAERIIVELRDKVAEHASSSSLTSALEVTRTTLIDDALSALLALGFNQKDAQSAIMSIGEQIKGLKDSGAIVKEALRYI